MALMVIVSRPSIQKGIGCLMGGSWFEAGQLGAIGMRFGNFVIRHFPSPTLLSHKLIQIQVELQHNTRGKGHIGIVSVNSS